LWVSVDLTHLMAGGLLAHVCTGVNQAIVKRMQIKLFQSSDKSISVTDGHSVIVRLSDCTEKKT